MSFTAAVETAGIAEGAASGAHWRALIVEPPRAHGAPLPLAVFKSMPEDFLVDEVLSFVPSGLGPHWLLRIEKHDANTRWIAAQLARQCGVRENEVGYAGLKDRRAMTRQWFSVPEPRRPIDARSLGGSEFRVLECARNDRKLRRGALTGNRFVIRLRNANWPESALAAKLERVRHDGVPNYFGAQRFGRDCSNLQRAFEWAVGGNAPRSHAARGFALSAARALIFNAVLAHRVRAGEWSRLSVGDVASLDGSGSHFRVDELDDALSERCARLDIHPSGPLWGRGDPPAGAPASANERAVAERFGELAALLEREGLRQERRSLRCRVQNLSVLRDHGDHVIEFELGRGQFATAVLREICEFDAVPMLCAAVESQSDDE